VFTTYITNRGFFFFFFFLWLIEGFLNQKKNTKITKHKQTEQMIMPSITISYANNKQQDRLGMCNIRSFSIHISFSLKFLSCDIDKWLVHVYLDTFVRAHNMCVCLYVHMYLCMFT
jgi:hypothetical protein